MTFKKRLKILVFSLLACVLVCAIGVGIYVLSIDYPKLNTAYLDSKSKSVIVTDEFHNNLTYFGEGCKGASLVELPKYVPNSFLSIEDKRFYKHKGLDYLRIAKATINNIKAGGYKEGASTISQQLVKNTHLTNEKNIKRKLKEAKLAKELENKYTKDQILELYLNVVYFGNGVYGIEAASQFYFSKSARELNLSEAATLAAIINSPAKYNPYKNFENLNNRKNTVLKSMKNNGFITQEEYEQAINQEVYISKSTKNIEAIYTKFAVLEAKEILKQRGITTLAGFKIITYYDANYQAALKLAYDKYLDNIKNVSNKTADYCGIILDNNQNGIKAYYTNNLTNILPKRQPGSTFKPIAVYAPALERGLISPATPILDEPININGYSPKNYKGKHYGWIDIRTAIKTSNNIAAVKTLYNLGIDDAIQTVNSCGIKLTDQDYGLSIALGGLHEGVSLTELTNAYTVFANGGKYSKCSFVKEILNEYNQVIYRNISSMMSVMRDDTAYLMTDMLMSAVKDGTAKRIYPKNYQVAAKTGTVSYNDTSFNNDAYCIAYTSQDTFGVWIGNLDNTQEDALPENITGGTYPAKIVSEALDNVYQKNTPPPFVVPMSVVSAQIDMEHYNNEHKVVLADSYTLGYNRKNELFSIYNLPPKKTVIKWDSYYEDKIKDNDNSDHNINQGIENIDKSKSFFERIRDLIKRWKSA